MGGGNDDPLHVHVFKVWNYGYEDDWDGPDPEGEFYIEVETREVKIIQVSFRCFWDEIEKYEKELEKVREYLHEAYDNVEEDSWLED